MDISALDRGLVIIYFVVTLAVAAAVSRRVKSFDEFMIAGRRMSLPLLVCTLVSTYYGLGVLLAGSEISYEAGIVSFVFDTAPAYLLVLLMALFVAGRLRRDAESRSIPDLVGARFGLGPRLCAAGACLSTPCRHFRFSDWVDCLSSSSASPSKPACFWEPS